MKGAGVVLLAFLAACGSVTAADVDAGNTRLELEGGTTGDLEADGSTGAAAEVLPRAAADAGAEVIPPTGAPTCARDLPAAACDGCPSSEACRRVVACIASDPHYVPLVATCNMTVGTGNERDALTECVDALLARC